MPGGYGTSGPWSSAGETYSQPQPSWSSDGGGYGVQSPVNNTVADAINAFQSAPPQLSFTQDLQDKAQLAIASQTPDPGYQTFEELAALAATDPKYDDSFYAPNTLGKFVATQWDPKSQKDIPILDSSGNLIFTGLGKHIKEQGQGSGINLENLQGIEKEYYKGLAEQEQFENQKQSPYGYGPPGGGGSTGGGPGGWLDVKMFSRGRPENIHPYWQDIAGTSMLPVAGSGAGGSLAAADELYALAAGQKAFSMTPEEQGILALLNA